jgi:hypothetical protein
MMNKLVLGAQGNFTKMIGVTLFAKVWSIKIAKIENLLKMEGVIMLRGS